MATGRLMKTVTIALGALALVVFLKYADLATISFVDGDGIGVHWLVNLLGLWHDDLVLTADIPILAA
ncbi:MAG: hypothetical protein Q8P31_02995, partial [Bacillota bacterium]|nr:hypothetical protein [Bacillota bacterium]